MNGDLVLNHYIGQQNNGVHNALFDTNSQPSINTTLAGLDVAVPIVGPPIAGETFCYGEYPTMSARFRGWALFHVVSATKWGRRRRDDHGLLPDRNHRSASADDVRAISDSACAGLFHGIYAIKLID